MSEKVVEIRVRFVDCLKFWLAALIVAMIPMIVMAIIMVILISLMTAAYISPFLSVPYALH